MCFIGGHSLDSFRVYSSMLTSLLYFFDMFLFCLYFVFLLFFPAGDRCTALYVMFTRDPLASQFLSTDSRLRCSSLCNSFSCHFCVAEEAGGRPPPRRFSLSNKYSPQHQGGQRCIACVIYPGRGDFKLSAETRRRPRFLFPLQGKEDQKIMHRKDLDRSVKVSRVIGESLRTGVRLSMKTLIMDNTRKFGRSLCYDVASSRNKGTRKPNS